MRTRTLADVLYDTPQSSSRCGGVHFIFIMAADTCAIRMLLHFAFYTGTLCLQVLSQASNLKVL